MPLRAAASVKSVEYFSGESVSILGSSPMALAACSTACATIVVCESSGLVAMTIRCPFTPAFSAMVLALAGSYG